MGAALSSASASQSTEKECLPISERRPLRHCVGGVPVPAEASTAPQDSKAWYADFFGTAFCTPHIDGKSIIIFEPGFDNEYPNPRARAGWPIKRLRKAYQLLDKGHPRIVRYVNVEYLWFTQHLSQ